nr:hypothetical protein Iba_scaffold13866CG0010 [Ipomoea batatas]
MGNSKYFQKHRLHMDVKTAIVEQLEFTGLFGEKFIFLSAMARNRAHRFWDSFTQSCGLPANLFAGESNLMGGSDSDLAVLLEPIVLGVCNLKTST